MSFITVVVSLLVNIAIETDLRGEVGETDKFTIKTNDYDL